MTNPLVALPPSPPQDILARGQRVLLLDRSQVKGDLRADVMRNVDCAADVLRSATPPRRIAFFVGGPEYLSVAPHSATAADADTDRLDQEMVAASPVRRSQPSSQRWGILEAGKRISSVRPVSEAPSRATREAPRSPRWAEAIEPHSSGGKMRSQPTFATAIAVEKEGLL